MGVYQRLNAVMCASNIHTASVPDTGRCLGMEGSEVFEMPNFAVLVAIPPDRYEYMQRTLQPIVIAALAPPSAKAFELPFADRGA